MDDSTEKAYGVLSYIGILVLIPLIAGKSPFARYHANQGLVLFIAEIILGVVDGILFAILGLIPFVGLLIVSILSGVVGLVSLIFMIIGIVHAANGEMKELPIIGGIKLLK